MFQTHTSFSFVSTSNLISKLKTQFQDLMQCEERQKQVRTNYPDWRPAEDQWGGKSMNVCYRFLNSLIQNPLIYSFHENCLKKDVSLEAKLSFSDCLQSLTRWQKTAESHLWHSAVFQMRVIIVALPENRWRAAKQRWCVLECQETNNSRSPDLIFVRFSP